MGYVINCSHSTLLNFVFLKIGDDKFAAIEEINYFCGCIDKQPLANQSDLFLL